MNKSLVTTCHDHSWFKQSCPNWFRPVRFWQTQVRYLLSFAALPAILLLSACVSDFRENDVTRPIYVNPLETEKSDEVETVPLTLHNEVENEVMTPAFRFVEARDGDTARTIAERTNSDPDEVAGLNGVFPDAPLSAGRLIQVPVGNQEDSRRDISRIAASALGLDKQEQPASESVLLKDPFASNDKLPPPPISDQPLPDDIGTVDLPRSPDFSQYQSALSETRFQSPVEGEIVREFGSGGEGINIAAPEGSPVVAAENGEVFMLSQASDDTSIVMIRHPEEHYTVYSNLKNLAVEKGQKVTRGQNLGTIAGGDKEFLHFEVRVGIEETDPVPYIR